MKTNDGLEPDSDDRLAQDAHASKLTEKSDEHVNDAEPVGDRDGGVLDEPVALTEDQVAEPAAYIGFATLEDEPPSLNPDQAQERNGAARSISQVRLRKALPFLLSGRDLASNLNVYMFLEDVRMGTAEYIDKISLVTEFSKERKDKLRSILSSAVHDNTHRGGWNYSSLERLIRKLASNILSDLIRYGCSVFQIMRNEGEPNLLHRFTPERLVKLPWFFVQNLPKLEAERHHQKFIFIPTKDVLRITMPNELGGPRRHKIFIRLLSQSDQLNVFLEGLGGNKKSIFELPYDSEAHRRMQFVYVSRLTRLWGWNRRDSSLEHQTEYRYVHNYLTFQWAVVVLSNYALDKAASVIQDLYGDVVKYSNKSEAKTVLKIIEKLKIGEIDFSTAMDRAKTVSRPSSGSDETSDMNGEL